MLFLLIAPAVVAATCGDWCLPDDHAVLLQSRTKIHQDTRAVQDLPTAQLQDAEASIEGLKKELAVERGVLKKVQAAEIATRKDAAAVATQLEQLEAKAEAVKERRQALNKTLHRVSLAKEQNKATLLQSLMDASWKEATEATEAALVAERQAESRRQQAEKAKMQNEAQRSEVAALRRAEAARRDQVMALRAVRDATNASWDLEEHTEEKTEEIIGSVTDEIVSDEIEHVKPVKHAKATVIKTRRASRRADARAAELAAIAVNASALAWQWKDQYHAAHPKALQEKKKLVTVKTEASEVAEEEENILAEKKRLEEEKTRLEAKVAEFSDETARAEARVAEAVRLHTAAFGEDPVSQP